MEKIDELKIEILLKQLTLEEKIGMIHGSGLFCTQGVERLGIPPLKMSDGPMGVRKEFKERQWRTIGTSDDFVTYLPSNTALASTWNRELAKKAGHVLGQEARGRGKDVILAPGINIQRSPLCGRNFEYMSEDPCLIEEMAVPFIEGIQTETDTAACVKHFAANAQETERLSVDTKVEERALREIYLPGFLAAVKKAGSLTIMGAYNKLRGEYCSQSKHLLNGILRKEWMYDGAVISDWGAVHDTKAAAESGLDIEMSVSSQFDEYFMANPLLEAVRKGKVKEEDIDTKVRNILRLMYRLHMIGKEAEKRNSGTYNLEEHRETALQTAREAIVLLKNEENRLPLNKEELLKPYFYNAEFNTLKRTEEIIAEREKTTIEREKTTEKEKISEEKEKITAEIPVRYHKKKLAVIGQNAVRLHSNGGGSAEIKALYEISPLMGLKKSLGGNVEVIYSKGYYVPQRFEYSDVSWQESSIDTKEDEEAFENLIKQRKKEMESEDSAVIEKKKAQYLKEAVELAKSADEVIFIGGLDHEYDIEGRDRPDMKLPYEQDTVIEAVLSANPNTIIVMMAGAPVELPWIDKAKAVVWYSYAGTEGGTALAEVLLGDINPSGKLPMTMPNCLEDSPAHHFGEFGTKESVTFKEGVYVGYRYYDTYGVKPMFPFGHGLSYTTFEYDDLEIEVVEEVGIDFTGKILKEEDLISPFEVNIAFTVKNTKDRDGAETVQVYVNDLDSLVGRPIHELKGFTKVYLKAGEEKRIELKLKKEAFGFYNEKKKCFEAEAGDFEIQIGSSSRDLRLSAVIELETGYCYQ